MKLRYLAVVLAAGLSVWPALALGQENKGTVEGLYVIECGQGHADDVSRWSPGVNVGKPIDYVSNCYLSPAFLRWRGRNYGSTTTSRRATRRRSRRPTTTRAAAERIRGSRSSFPPRSNRSLDESAARARAPAQKLLGVPTQRPMRARWREIAISVTRPIKFATGTVPCATVSRLSTLLARLSPST
jgi:hypothetical protein